MELMMLVPSEQPKPHAHCTLSIVHNCEVPEEEDEIANVIKGTKIVPKLARWFLRKRITSWKHPLTLWCLKSTKAVKYEVNRHLKTYPYMIHPFSLFRIFWESLIVVFSFIVLIITPVLLAFFFHEREKWQVFDNIIDTIFICDVTIWFFTGYYDYRTKMIVLDPKIVARKYLKGFFLIDTLPVLPLKIIVNRSSEYLATFSLVKILRMRITIVYSRRLRYVYRINRQRYKILEMSMVTIIVVHWAACLEYFIPVAVSHFFGENAESWIVSTYMQSKNTKLKKYLTCLNRGTNALIGSAHYLVTKTPEDIILNLILSILGSLGFIYILGQLLLLITTFHSARKKHLRIIEQLQVFMRYKELPQALQRRLVTFCNYRNKKSFERYKPIIIETSPYLREKLILHNYLRMIESVELFQYMPQSMVVHLASVMRSEIYLINDVIVKAGTPGEALYFVAAGTVAVFTSLGKEVCHLEDGAHFGEVALVMEKEHRIATVVAVETCEIYVLHRNDFQHFIKDYPDLQTLLRNVVLEHLEKTLVLDDAYMREESVLTHINISNLRSKRRESSV